MLLLREVDFYKTRNSARKVLKQYRRLERIAGRSTIDLRSPIITDMPRNAPTGNKTEDAILQRLDAETERDAIICGLMALSLSSRQVLYYSYCTPESYSNIGISSAMGYSVRTIEEYKSEALIEFAEAYKKGALIVYQK